MLNFRVRNGNGWVHQTIVTDQIQAAARWLQQGCIWNGVEAVSVGTYVYCDGQTERTISTGLLHASLRFHTQPINLVVFEGPSGRAHLEGGFPLRCFQRLSRPYVATRQCRWRDNRNTRGTFTPVLSY